MKALATVKDVTLLQIAIEAARDAGAARVVVVGGPQVRAHCEQRVDGVVDAASDGRENVRRALALPDQHEALLLLASDMPFLRGDDIAAFLKGAGQYDNALPVADVDTYERTFPGAPAHVTRLAGDRVINGSVVYFGPGAAPKASALAQRFFAARKSRLRMAALLGPRLTMRFAMGALRVADVESRAQAFGFQAGAVRGCAPGLCFDIDGIDDYRYARERAGAR